MFQLRNPFRRAPKPEKEPLVDVVHALARRVSDLEADATQLRLEWSETLDKINAWANRQAQRDRRAAHKLLEAPQNDDQPLGDQVDTPPADPVLAKDQLRRRIFGGGRR